MKHRTEDDQSSIGWCTGAQMEYPYEYWRPKQNDSVRWAVAATASNWIYNAGENDAGEEVKNPKEHQVNGVDGVTVTYEPLRNIGAELQTQQIKLATLLARATCETSEKTQQTLATWLVLVFSGTSNAQDWVYNFSSTIDWKSFRDYGLGVHAGWQSVLTTPAGYENLELRFLERVRDHCMSVNGIIVTGHSLGGALAKITALRMKQVADVGMDKRIHRDQHTSEEQRLLKQLGMNPHQHERQQLLKLLDNAKCITFAAPNPFALPPEVRTASQVSL